MVVEGATSSGDVGDSWRRKLEDGGEEWTSVRDRESLR